MRYKECQQILPISIEEAWDFFATPNNLNKITPPEMHFEIKSKVPKKMYEGLMIHYSIKPFLNIPLNWLTEITHIKEGAFFVDEQRKGPYAIWHHEHHFESHTKGVLMTDKLHYDIGMGFLGSIAGAVFVHRQVDRIFNHRQQILGELFPIKG